MVLDVHSVHCLEQEKQTQDLKSVQASEILLGAQNRCKVWVTSRCVRGAKVEAVQGLLHNNDQQPHWPSERKSAAIFRRLLCHGRLNQLRSAQRAQQRAAAKAKAWAKKGPQNDVGTELRPAAAG